MAILLQKVWFTAHQISYTVTGGIEVVSNQLWGFHNVAGSYRSARIMRVSKKHYKLYLSGHPFQGTLFPFTGVINLLQLEVVSLT